MTPLFEAVFVNETLPYFFPLGDYRPFQLFHHVKFYP